MRNVITVLLVLLVCILALMVHSQSKSIKELQAKQAVTPNTPAAASLELQGKCAKQAAEVFKGWPNIQQGGYENHFNTKLGKCLVMVSNMTMRGKEIIDSQNLSDAFEGKIFGNYVWINPGGKKFWEVEPTECYVDLPSGERHDCKSSDEFNELAKAYME